MPLMHMQWKQIITKNSGIIISTALIIIIIKLIVGNHLKTKFSS